MGKRDLIESTNGLYSAIATTMIYKLTKLRSMLFSVTLEHSNCCSHRLGKYERNELLEDSLKIYTVFNRPILGRTLLLRRPSRMNGH